MQELVEAAGIEPASEEVTRRASTSVAQDFSFAQEAPLRRFLMGYLDDLSSSPPRIGPESVLVYLTPAPVSQDEPGLDGYFI